MRAGPAAGAAGRAAARANTVAPVGPWRGTLACGARRPGSRLVAAGMVARWPGRFGIVAGRERWPVPPPARDEQALACVDQVRIGDRAPVDLEDAPPGPLVAIVKPCDALQRVARCDDVPASALHRPARPPARVRPALVPVPHPRPWAVAVRFDCAPTLHLRGRWLDGPRRVRLGPAPLLPAGCGRRPIRIRPLRIWGRQVRSERGMQPGRAPGQLVHHVLEAVPGAPQPRQGVRGPRPAAAVPDWAAAWAACAARAPVVVRLSRGRQRRHGQRPEQGQARAACGEAATASRQRKESPQHAHRILSYARQTRDAVNDVAIR